MPSRASLTSARPVTRSGGAAVVAVYDGEAELFAERAAERTGRIAGFLILTGVPAVFWSLALVYGLGAGPTAVAAFAFAIASVQAFVWTRLCSDSAVRSRRQI